MAVLRVRLLHLYSVWMPSGAAWFTCQPELPSLGAMQMPRITVLPLQLLTTRDGGIAFANAGWYVLHFSASIADNTLTSKLTVYPGEAYVIGTVMSQSTWGHDPATQLTAPADASGEWVSPKFLAGGELRASIKVPGLDWWRTEFTLYKGDLYWRNCDIPDNWAVNVGSDYSVSCSAGQKLYVNFDYDTGRVE